MEATSLKMKQRTKKQTGKAIRATKTLGAMSPNRCVGRTVGIDTPSHPSSVRFYRNEHVGLQSRESTTSSDDSDEELPYGGDMQRAVQAQDRDAIRTLMAARKNSGTKVRDSSVLLLQQESSNCSASVLLLNGAA